MFGLIAKGWGRRVGKGEEREVKTNGRPQLSMLAHWMQPMAIFDVISNVINFGIWLLKGHIKHKISQQKLN